jgi:hypothetical protein
MIGSLDKVCLSATTCQSGSTRIGRSFKGPYCEVMTPARLLVQIVSELILIELGYDCPEFTIACPAYFAYLLYDDVYVSDTIT